MWRDVRTHLPRVTARHPQAAALSVKIGSKAGGTKGRGPSLHVDASRVHSPPPFPRFPALRCCGSSVRRGIRCCGLGGQGARQLSLRSGRLWRPARAEQDNSRRHTPCPQCLLLVRRGEKPASRSCVIPPIAQFRCFGGHGRWRRPCSRHQLSMSTSQKNTAPPNKRLCVAGKVGAADSPALFLRRSSRQSHAPDGGSSLRTISAGV